MHILDVGVYRYCGLAYCFGAMLGVFLLHNTYFTVLQCTKKVLLNASITKITIFLWISFIWKNRKNWQQSFSCYYILIYNFTYFSFLRNISVLFWKEKFFSHKGNYVPAKSCVLKLHDYSSTNLGITDLKNVCKGASPTLTKTR